MSTLLYADLSTISPFEESEYLAVHTDLTAEQLDTIDQHLDQMEDRLSNLMDLAQAGVDLRYSMGSENVGMQASEALRLLTDIHSYLRRTHFKIGELKAGQPVKLPD